MNDTPKFKGGVYLHYKGGLYSAFTVVAHHETREFWVMYFSLSKGNVQIRKLYPADGEDAWTDIIRWNQGTPIPPQYDGPVDLSDTNDGDWAPRFIWIRDFE